MAHHRARRSIRLFSSAKRSKGTEIVYLDAHDLERMNDLVADVLRHEFLLLRKNRTKYTGASLMRSVCALSNMGSMTQFAFVAPSKSLCSLTHGLMASPRCKCIPWMANTIKHRAQVRAPMGSEWSARRRRWRGRGGRLILESNLQPHVNVGFFDLQVDSRFCRS